MIDSYDKKKTPRTGEGVAKQIQRIVQYALKRAGVLWDDYVDSRDAIVDADEEHIPVSFKNGADASLVPVLTMDNSCSSVTLEMLGRSTAIYMDGHLRVEKHDRRGVTKSVAVDLEDTASLHYVEYAYGISGLDRCDRPETAWTDNDPEVVAPAAAKMLGQIRGALAAAELAKKEQERARQEQERARQEKEKAKRLKQLREILG